MINLDINITITEQITHKLGYSIIPILITNLQTTKLFNILDKYINIDDKYKSILEHIENNIKNKNINVASLTIEDKQHSMNTIHTKHTNHTIHNSKTKKNNSTEHSKTKTKNNNNNTPFTKIHQIFIVVINNNSFNKTDDSELLESLRVSGNTIFNIVKSNNIKSFNLVDTIDKKTADKKKNNITKYVETILEGILLSSYKFNKYKTTQALNKTSLKYNLHLINLVIPKTNTISQQSQKTITSRIKHLTNIVKSVFIARDLINEPANVSKADRFIDFIKQFIKKHKLSIAVEVLEKDKLEKLNMGLILGVGKASSPENAPKVLIMRYTGHKCIKKDDDPAYVLLGKGITFDTGGLNLKIGKGMIEMKTDLSGAATVSAFLLGYALNNGKKCINVICPFAENSIGPEATKPSDVLTAYNGKTVEITNTDAEGRLVLADCLAYAVDKYPNAILIDFATLTGQQEALSSKMFSNILSVNSPAETDKMISSGQEINELLVPLPIMEKQLNKLESYTADIKNVSFTSSADIIMSSLFMRQFIKKDTKWLHIDIAGPSYKLTDVVKYASPEASGIGVRLLFNFFME